MQRAGQSVDRVLRGVDYPLSHLLDVTERIDWETVRVIAANISESCSREQVLGLGLQALRSPALRALVVMARYVFHPIEYYRFAAREVSRYCACLEASIRELGSGRLECHVRMRPGYEPIPEVFLALRGAFMAMTEVYGREPARVEMQDVPGGVVYEIHVSSRRKFWGWLRPWLTWGLTKGSVARQLHEAHEMLHERHLALLERDARLRGTERSHRLLLEQALDPTVILGREGLLLDANARACETFGEPLEALMGRSPADRIDVSEADLRTFLVSLRTGGGACVEGVVRRPDGEGVPVEIACSTLADGRIQAVLRERASERDGRERHAETLEAQVTARAAELEQANAELRTVQARYLEAERLRAAEAAAVGLSRSLNDPLTALIGTLEMAAETPVDAERAVRQGLHLARRMRTTLAQDAARLDPVGARRRPEPPARLVEDVRAALAPVARDRGVRIETKIEPGLPEILVDRTLLTGALLALGTNGIEAMQAGQTLTIEAELLEAIEVVQLRVVDEGSGIPRQVAESVLEPHFTTKGARAGLGLPIALGVVQGHGGHLRIEERPGGGTIATVEIRTTASRW